jgi:putative ABC transport system substrate-binding protein
MCLHIGASPFTGLTRRPARQTFTTVFLWIQVAFCLAGHADAAQSREPIYSLALASMSVSTAGNVLIPQVRGLYDGLEEAGYTEGSNLVVHKIHGVNEPAMRAALQDALRHSINAIVATSAMETAIAKQLSSTIPIIFAPARDPIRLGFVESYARPGGNLTGVSYSRNFDDSAKQLAVFAQTLPMMKRVTVLYAPATTSTETLDAVKRISGPLKLELTIMPTNSNVDAEQAVRAVSKANADGLFLVCSATFRASKDLTNITQPKRLPLFGCTGQHVADEGALMTYTPDIYFLGYRAAWYVDRVLKGFKPNDLPVGVPDRFETVINLATAKSLGIKIPPEKLILADKVFQ